MIVTKKTELSARAREIDYSLLKSGDVVIVSGNDPFSSIIKIFTSSPGESDYEAATHVGIVIDVWDQKLIAEMLTSGLQFTSFEDYLKRKNTWIIGVGRVDDITEAERALVCKAVSYDRRKTISYDWSGDLAFVGLGKNDKDKSFCSEYVQGLFLKWWGILIPSRKPGLCSPEDIHEFFKAGTPGRYLVDYFVK